MELFSEYIPELRTERVREDDFTSSRLRRVTPVRKVRVCSTR